MQDRIGQLCGQFKLPTMGAQSVARFTAAGHGDALATFLEVLEQEAEDRRHRRINRLRRESRLPSGKTWETFEHDPSPPGAAAATGPTGPGQLRGARHQRAGLRAARHRQDPRPGAPWATAWWKPATPSSSLRPTVWYRNCSPPSAIWTCPASCASWTTSTFLLLDDLGYLPQGAEESEVLFTSSPNATSAGRLGITSNLVFSDVGAHLCQPHGHRRGD